MNYNHKNTQNQDPDWYLHFTPEYLWEIDDPKLRTFHCWSYALCVLKRHEGPINLREQHPELVDGFIHAALFRQLQTVSLHD